MNPAVQTTHPPIAVFLSYSGDGGVERMMTLLARGMADRGHAVDLLVVKGAGGHFQKLHPQVRVLQVGANHTWMALPFLVRYLRRVRPRALLVAKDRANRTAIRARRWAGVDVPLVVRLGTHLRRSLQGKPRLVFWWRARLMRQAYGHADRVVAVSDGVAADTQDITGLPAGKITVIRNPTVFPEITERAEEPAEHPWFTASPVPLVVGIGRLTGQKDFATLIHAFAHLQVQRPSRLVIFGEGADRPALEALVEQLGLSHCVALPGFTNNPYAHLARADLFVLSSAWEGSPNVLVEAMAVGTPVVSTDCDSGPREILAGGAYGPLVEVGDAEALATAMERTLQNPLPANELQGAVSEYHLDRSVEGYLQALGIPSLK